MPLCGRAVGPVAPDALPAKGITLGRRGGASSSAAPRQRVLPEVEGFRIPKSGSALIAALLQRAVLDVHGLSGVQCHEAACLSLSKLFVFHGDEGPA